MPDAAIQLHDDEIRDLSPLIGDLITGARSDMQPAVNEIMGNRDYLTGRSERHDVPFAGACELVPPFVQESLLALIAEVAPSLLNTKPVFRYELAGMGEDCSRLWEPYLAAQLYEIMQARDVLEAWHYAGLRDGTAVLFTSWDTVVRRSPGWKTTTSQEVDALGMPAGPARVRRTRTWLERVVYDAPRLDLIPIEDFTCFPANDADVRTAELVGARINTTADALQTGVMLGMYDEDAVNLALADSATTPEAQSPEDARYMVGNNANLRPDSRRNVLTVWQGCYRLPGTMDDPAGDYWITYHEDSKTILRAVPLEEVYWSGRRPFTACRPYASERGLFGPSVASSGAGYVQDAKMTIMRLAVDAAALGVAPPMLVAASLYKRADEAIHDNRRPFGIIPFPDQYFANGGRAMTPFAPGMPPTAILAINEMLDTEGQKGTGATDTLKSMPTPNNITATQAQQIMESSKKLVGHLVEHCATAMSDVGQQLHELNRQYADRMSVQQLWYRINGASNVPLEVATASEYTVQSNGISETSNKAILAQRAMERIALLRSDETAWANPRARYTALHAALMDTGTRNPDDYLGTEDEYIMADQQRQQQMMMGALQQMTGGMAPPQ